MKTRQFGPAVEADQVAAAVAVAQEILAVALPENLRRVVGHGKPAPSKNRQPVSQGPRGLSTINSLTNIKRWMQNPTSPVSPLPSATRGAFKCWRY